MQNIMVYIPDLKRFLYAAEGTGDNLLDEDVDDGYVDYVYIETYFLYGNEFVEDDGGQMLLTEMFSAKYADDYDGDKLIRDAMEFIYDRRDFEYVVIEEGD